MPECPICIEKKRVIATCPRCTQQGCRDCMLRRALENPLLPQCVGTCKGLTVGDLRVTIGPSNIAKQFRPALKLALLEHEKKQIPNTMAAVAAVKRQEQAKEDLKVLETKLEEMAERVRAVLREQRDLEDTYRVTKNLAETRTLKDVQCGTRCQKDDCVGFTNHLGTCMVCHSPHCTICGVNVEGVEDHECNPDDVASLTEIKKTAKPCPSCGAPTTRISGCPQMWCTYCRTGYNYKSLTITRGPVENPHHNEYLRSLGGVGGAAPREPGDVPCGGFAHVDYRVRRPAYEAFNRLHPMALSVVPGYAEAYGKVSTMACDDEWWSRCRIPPFRVLAEKMTVHGDRLQRRIRSGNSQLTELRVQHIMKRIEDEEYMTKLVRLDTARRRDAELSPVMSLYVDMLQDYDRQWIALFNKGHRISEELRSDKDGARMQKWGKRVMELFQRLTQIQETVQEGLDAGAVALGIKRLGKICPDGVIRLN